MSENTERDEATENGTGTSRREQLFDQAVRESWRRTLSNSVLFDKTLLVTSGVGLLLLILMGSNGESPDGLFPCLSAGLFMAGHFMTLTSLLTCQRSLKRSEHIVHEYYICDNDDALSFSNPFAKLCCWLRGASILCVLVGTTILVFVVVFEIL